MFKNFTYIMSNKLFYIFAVVVVTLGIIVTIACCVELYYKKHDKYKPVGTWVNIDRPYYTIQIREDSVFFKTDKGTISRKVSFDSEDIVLYDGNDSIQGKFNASRGLTIEGIVVLLRLKKLGSLSGTYIKRLNEQKK